MGANDVVSRYARAQRTLSPRLSNRERVSVTDRRARGVLEALQNKIERDLEAEGLLETFRQLTLPRRPNECFLRRIVEFSPDSSPVRMEVLGRHLREALALDTGLRIVLGNLD